MADKQKNVFLTGITGFLGSFLAKELIQNGFKVFGLARSKGDKSAYQRAFDAIRFAYYDDEWDERKVADSLKIFEGDIVYKDLGLNDKDQDFLQSETDIIIHSAALAELRSPWETIKRINVDGTKNVLDFAVECHEKGRLRKFNHISTMYVCGDYQGEFDETMLDVRQNFNNTYEKSKFEAEKLVHEYMDKRLNCSIFRPSLIMGDSRSGKTNNFKLFYQPLRFFINEIYDEFPADKNCSQNFINIDTVAKTLVALLSNIKTSIYHILSPNNISVGYFFHLAQGCFCFKSPRLIPLSDFPFYKFSYVQKELATPFIPYLNLHMNFIAEYSRVVFESYKLNFLEISDQNLLNIFSFYMEYGFLNRK